MSTELRDLVNILTRSHTLEVTQHGRTIGHRTQTALLTKLRDAVTMTVPASSNGGATALPNQRSPFNVEASDLHNQINRQIRAWATNLDVPQRANWGDPTALLRTVQVQLLADARIDLRPYEATLRGWLTTISSLIVDPPRRWTINGPCPTCGKARVTNEDGDENDALNVTERDPINLTVTWCRNCGARWDGLDGARRLALAMDEAAHRITA